MDQLFAYGQDIYAGPHTDGHRPGVAVAGNDFVEVQQDDLGAWANLRAHVGVVQPGQMRFLGDPIPFGVGEHAAVAADGALVVIVYERGDGGYSPYLRDEYWDMSGYGDDRYLWSLLCRITRPAGGPPTLTTLSHQCVGSSGLGRHPSVALRPSPGGGHLVVCMVSHSSGWLGYWVGTIAAGAGEVAWGRPRLFREGYLPSVTMPQWFYGPLTDVFAAYQTEPSTSELALAHGKINVGDRTIRWDPSVTYGRGFAPTIGSTQVSTGVKDFVELAVFEAHQTGALAPGLWYSRDGFAWRTREPEQFIESDASGMYPKVSLGQNNCFAAVYERLHDHYSAPNEVYYIGSAG